MKNIIWIFLITIPLGLAAQPDYDKASRKAMMVYQITDKMDLSEEQAEKFFPKYRSHRKVLGEIEEDMKESFKSIHESLKDGSDLSDRDLDLAIKEMESFEKKKLKARIDFMNELDGILTTKQRAQLLMMPHGMKKEAKEKIKKHKKQKKRRHNRNKW